MAWLTRILFPEHRQKEQAARALFDAIVEQARRPELYSEMGLPDTLDGRFHAITLHAALVFPRLESAGEAGKRISHHLNIRIFDSFDSALRETGVGDASIARKVRRMGERFAGVGMAVHTALQETNPVPALANVLERNGILCSPASMRLSEMLVMDAASLATLADTDLLAGRTGWHNGTKAQ